MTTKVKKACEHCGKQIQVRQADIDRGWGRFCSKSCKASNQHQTTRKKHRDEMSWTLRHWRTDEYGWEDDF